MSPYISLYMLYTYYQQIKALEEPMELTSTCNSWRKQRATTEHILDPVSTKLTEHQVTVFAACFHCFKNSFYIIYIYICISHYTYPIYVRLMVWALRQSALLHGRGPRVLF